MSIKEELIQQIDALKIPDNHLLAVTIVDTEGDCRSKIEAGKGIKTASVLREMCFTTAMSLLQHMYKAFMKS